jgi:hypothetical protein
MQWQWIHKRAFRALLAKPPPLAVVGDWLQAQKVAVMEQKKAPR